LKSNPQPASEPTVVTWTVSPSTPFQFCRTWSVTTNSVTWNVWSENVSSRDIKSILTTVPSKTTSVVQNAWQAGPLEVQVHASAEGAPANCAKRQSANPRTMELIRVENNCWSISAGTSNIIRSFLNKLITTASLLANRLE
jgi:hypothetical protein